MASTSYPDAKYGSTEQMQPGKQQGKGQEDNCCVSMAKCWITLIGILSMLFASALIFIAIYTKYFYAEYAALNAVLEGMGVSAAVWIILAFGVVLFICSLLLIVAGCYHDSASCAGCAKMLLVVFASILIILLVAEIASSIAVFFYMGLLKLPAGNGTILGKFETNFVELRTSAVTEAYQMCCVVNHPPYTNVNGTIDQTCLWPEAATTSPSAFSEVYNTCGDAYSHDAVGVEECLCHSNEAWYGEVAGVFLSQNVMWVGIVGIVFAVLLLFGVIASCALICHGHKSVSKREATYNDQRN